jgi:hypothetical protein
MVHRRQIPVITALVLWAGVTLGGEARVWETWDDCQLEVDKYYDGDSFTSNTDQHDNLEFLPPPACAARCSPFEIFLQGWDSIIFIAALFCPRPTVTMLVRFEKT